MKLDSIQITNYKSIHHLDLSLSGNSAVIFGINGTGKSTFLSAIVSVFIPFLNKVLASKRGTEFSSDDVSIGEHELCIIGNIISNEKSFSLQRFFKRIKENERNSKPTWEKSEYEHFSTFFKGAFLSNQGKGMPIFVYYGTNRAVLSIPDKLESNKYDKLSALERATTNTVDFKSFFSWYRDRESMETIDMRNSIKAGEEIRQDIMLSSVQHAIGAMLEGISDLQIKRDPIRMTVMKDGNEVRVDMLSDGEKCTLALIGDLARRLCLANPSSTKPLEGSGIVLIDEIELHMHPTWQRKVLHVLKTVFPNIQFIISTHSPQVLGETNDEFLVFAIDADRKEFINIGRLDGADSNLILEKYMRTASLSETTQRLIDQINMDIVTDHFTEAEEKLQCLCLITGPNSEHYILAKGFLERSKLLHA